LDDPFDDPVGIIIPSKSPEPVRDREYNRLDDDFNIDHYYKDTETEEKVKEKLQEHEARNRALVLEMFEDLPDADIKPPENVLFVCKLNPVTQDDDLELIFSRFGPIKSCQIIRDWKTSQSLKYAFIEFETVEACEQAFFKMNGVVIDERRIKVDFSQSVSKLWQNFKKNQDKKFTIGDNTNELLLPNENQKLEIRANKNFMIDNKDYKMVFDHPDDERNYKPNFGEKDREYSNEEKNKHSKPYQKHRSTSRDKRHDRNRKSKNERRDRKRSRSRSRSKSHSRDRKHRRR
jgi:peptidyl-prolyl cis-trans isomerase-like 4